MGNMVEKLKAKILHQKCLSFTGGRLEEGVHLCVISSGFSTTMALSSRVKAYIMKCSAFCFLKMRSFIIF